MAMTASLATWRAAAQQMSFENHNIAYWDNGVATQPTVLLVHGFPTSSWDWHQIWPQLNAQWHLVAADMLGFGLSDKPQGYRYTIAQQADLYVALLEQLELKAVHILAHDYGNTVVQELLARHDAGLLACKIESICFLNGGLFPETHHALPVQKLLNSKVGWLLTRLSTQGASKKNFDRIFGADTKVTELQWRDIWDLIEYKQGRKNFHLLIKYINERRTHRARWVGALQTTAVPLQLIDGLADPVSGAHMVVRYRALIPQPYVVELPNIGHYPQLEAAPAVLAGWRAFMQRLKPVAAE